MFALSLSLVLATSPLPPPPLVTGEVEAPSTSGRSARLLDAESQAKLADLDRREAALQPTDKQKTLRTLGVISLSVAVTPVAACVVGMFVGLFIGAGGYGIGGAFVGMLAGLVGVALIIPWPLWLVAAGLGVASGILFNAAKSEGAANERELRIIRAQRREVLHPTPLATIATF